MPTIGPYTIHCPGRHRKTPFASVRKWPKSEVCSLTSSFTQHHPIQCHHRRPLALPAPREGHHVHHSCLPSDSLRPRARRADCSLRCWHPESSRLRYERSQASSTGPTVVYYQILWSTGEARGQGLLYASQSRIWDLHHSLVSACPGIHHFPFPFASKKRNSHSRGVANLLWRLRLWFSVLFFVYLVLSLISLYPTASHRTSVGGGKSADEVESRPWEMTSPHTPGLQSPTTPRTTAFNTLSGKQPPVRQGNQSLPLRHHISMGDETYAGPSNR